MEQQTQESIEIILAQIYGLAQVINNLSIQVNNLINIQINSQNNNQVNNQINNQVNNQNNNQINNQDNNQINNQDNNQINNQVNSQINNQNNSQNNNQVNSQINSQDYSPELFSKKDMEMNIQESLNYIWKSEKLKFQVFHAVTPYVHHVKSRVNANVSDNDMWNFLSCKKLLRHFNDSNRHDQFLKKNFEEKTKWIYNILCSKVFVDKWKSDAVKYFLARSSDNSNPSDQQTFESLPDPTPGLSEFEFCRGGIRYYYDEYEKCDIEIPQDFLPRPDAESWLNTHSGWMHG